MPPKKQLLIPGTETDLSRACDEYTNALSNLQKAQNSMDLAAEDIVSAMKKHGKTSIRLDGGGMIVFSAGRTTKDRVFFKKRA